MARALYYPRLLSGVVLCTWTKLRRPTMWASLTLRFSCWFDSAFSPNLVLIDGDVLCAFVWFSSLALRWRLSLVLRGGHFCGLCSLCILLLYLVSMGRYRVS